MAKDVHIPKPKPVQLGILDQLVDRTAIANDISPVPLSERAILRELEGSDRSGHRRAEFGDDIEQMLLWLFTESERRYGYDMATLILFKYVANDHSYIHVAPQWIRDVFDDQEELLMETFHGNSADRRVEPGSCDDDEETQPREPLEPTVFEATMEQLDVVLTKLEEQEDT